MSRLNTHNSITTQRTHEGAPAKYLTPFQQLRRSVLSSLLWEDQFYEDGKSIAERVTELAKQVTPKDLSSLAIEAKEQFKLRHMPLLLAAVLCRTGSGRMDSLVSNTIERVICRADELSEFLAVYANINGVQPNALKKTISAQAKKGLARAFRKFDAYSLAKYDRDGPIKLRDVLFLCHARPKDKEQEETWKQLIAGTLPIPDTWEVALSAGVDKKETFERLLRENKLGYMALLRNLRNMVSANVDRQLIETSIRELNSQKILPFRFVAAAKAVPSLEPALDEAMIKSISELPKFSGKTMVLVDVSDSMNSPLSAKSDMTRMHAASALASIINSDQLQVFSFSTNVVEVPPRRGLAGVDAVINSQRHSSTRMAAAIKHVNQFGYDRLIVVSDEQSEDGIAGPLPGSKAYMINVASYQNGVGYGHEWINISGFSENVIKYIAEMEKANDI